VAPVAAVEPPAPLPIRGVQEPVASAPVDTDVAARIAALEGRVDEQDIALRRVLTLMVDWIEGDQRPDAAALRRVTG
jgi:hypothetical protein